MMREINLIVLLFVGITFFSVPTAQSSETRPVDLFFFSQGGKECEFNQWVSASGSIKTLISFPTCPKSVFRAEEGEKIYAVFEEKHRDESMRGDPIYGEFVTSIQGKIKEITLTLPPTIKDLRKIASKTPWFQINQIREVWNPNLNVAFEAPPPNPFQVEAGRAQQVGKDLKTTSVSLTKSVPLTKDDFEGWFFKKFRFASGDSTLFYRVQFGHLPHVMELVLATKAKKEAWKLSNSHQWSAQLAGHYLLVFVEFEGDKAQLINLENGQSVIRSSLLFPIWY